MIRLRIANLLAVVAVGSVIAAYVHYDDLRWMEAGRDAFLSAQNHRFDGSIAHPHSLVHVMISGILLTAIFIGLYELLSAGLSKIFPATTVVRNQE